MARAPRGAGSSRPPVPTTKELLDPKGWGEVLELYARSVNLAVALVDHEGHLIGTCHNPKPIWLLARRSRTIWGSACMFCLDEAGRCTAAADAERTHSMALARDMGGHVHIATPIFLEGRHLGTLLAGQVLDQYPEMLLLERVAREFDLSGQELWDLARERIPVSRITLTTYGNVLGTLGNAYLRERHAGILQRILTATNEKLQRSNEELTGKIAELDQSLAEKDILLNEVHHRVNNNLAVIASLLRMQAEAFPDDRVTGALRNSQLRVEAMALIHAHLYNAADWRAVNFGEYAAVLADNLFRSHGVDRSRIRLRVEIGRLDLSVDKAIPAGLILNELLSNALKHAFPDGRRGSILIQGQLLDGEVEFSVQDDGAGMPEPGEPRRNRPLGLNIVNVLCRQLKGTVDRLEREEQSPGCTFRVRFPYITPSRKPPQLL